MMGPGFCLHEQPGQGSWTRTAEHLGVLPPDPPWAGARQSPSWEPWVLRQWAGRAAWGQVLAKGPGWASCTSGPGDLDPSSLELRLRMRGQWGTVLRLHVRVMAVPRKGSAADGGRGTRGPRARQAGASV